jgi:hypothetical protein
MPSPRNPMRLFVQKPPSSTRRYGGKEDRMGPEEDRMGPLDWGSPEEGRTDAADVAAPPMHGFVQMPKIFSFNSVDVSTERRQWLSQTPFLTTALGGSDDVRLALFVADDSTLKRGLCAEARDMMSGLCFEMISVYAEEVWFLATALDADLMLCSSADVRLARMEKE